MPAHRKDRLGYHRGVRNGRAKGQSIGGSNHGRQDTQATAEAEEAEAGHAPDQERLVAKTRKKARSGSSGQAIKAREVALPDGGKLVLQVDGSIAQLDADAEIVKTTPVEDPAWTRLAIRFGFIPQPMTVKPMDARSRH
jgi:hypothetical protein